MKREYGDIYAPRMKAKRTKVPVHPGGFRDTGVLTIDSLNSV